MVLGAALFTLLALGFVLFTVEATREAAADVPRADGIVVLTGAELRLREGGELLTKDKGRRLLISGANRITSRDELRHLSGLDKAHFDCCVDIGYDAQDTAGNAEETRAWVKANNFASVIVVTSNYHMPRSLPQIGRELPGTRLIPFPVARRQGHPLGWSGYARRLRTLAAEYVKFLPSAARLGLARLMRSLDPRSGSGPAQRAS